jgi:exodeoxyribonuclease VII small subunit
VTGTRKSLNFEKSLAELEALVERMEAGEMSLEESLKAFEQGVRLTQQCQLALTEAQQRVQMLTVQDGELRAEPLPGADEASAE